MISKTHLYLRLWPYVRQRYVTYYFSSSPTKLLPPSFCFKHRVKITQGFSSFFWEGNILISQNKINKYLNSFHYPRSCRGIPFLARPLLCSPGNQTQLARGRPGSRFMKTSRDFPHMQPENWHQSWEMGPSLDCTRNTGPGRSKACLTVVSGVIIWVQ